MPARRSSSEHHPARRTAGDYFLAVPIGIVLLLAGLAGAYTAAFDPPSDVLEHLMAAVVGLMGLAFGVGFLAFVLPARLGVGAFLMRWLGWLPGVSLGAMAAALFAFPASAAENSTEIDSPLGAVVYGFVVAAFAVVLLRAWFSLRPARPERGSVPGKR